MAHFSVRKTFITDEYSQELTEALQFAVSQGLDSVELRSLYGVQGCDLSQAQQRLAAHLLTESGVSVCVVDSFVFKGMFDADNVKAHLELAKRYLELASKLAAPCLRVFAFWRDGAPERRAVVDALAQVAELSRPLGVRILVENGTFTTVAQGSELAALLTELRDHGVRAVWDPGNVKNGGWPETLCAGANALAPFIEHMHVKNVHLTASGKVFGSLFGGLVDWPEQLRLLRSIGYEGYLSVETHHRTAEGARMDRATLDFPGGYAFSAGGCEPTRQLLEELDRLLSN